MSIDYSQLDYEIERIEDRLKELEYQFVEAKSFRERRETLEEYRKLQGDQNVLMNLQPY